MEQDQALRAISDALRSPAAPAFVRRSVKAGYHEFFPDDAGAVDRLVDASFDRLAEGQRGGFDPEALRAATASLLDEPSRWDAGLPDFSRIYHRYKTELKPETDLAQLRPLIRGTRVLDYGCGSGYLAVRLARAGYRVVTTDVLDYRYEEARDLPFVQMGSPTDLRYAAAVARFGGGIDTALVQAVLHHIDPGDLPQVVRQLAEVAGYLLIKEDSYNLPGDLPGAAEAVARQPLLRDFVALPRRTQFQVLVLIDFFSNAIAQGIPQMNMPFGFRTVDEWRELLEACGLRVERVIVAGFEPGRMHKSCHVWFACASQPTRHS